MDPLLEIALDRRRFHLLSLGAAGATLGASLPALAQGSAARPLVLGMTLEPPGLDPTTGAAAAIGEIVLYNVMEPLTKVAEDGSALPLLALRWNVSSDQKRWTFTLRPNVRFHNGEPFDAKAVKFSFERAGAPQQPEQGPARLREHRRDRRAGSAHRGADAQASGTWLPALLAQSPAVIVEPKSAAGNAQNPVGTGPYRVAQWQRGASLSVVAWPGFRDAAAIRIPRVQFRFIGEPAAQVAALLAGDVDVFPRVAAARAMTQFKAQPKRFQVITASSRAKTILAINHQRAPLGDVRVRRAIAMAIDRKAVIQASADGFGVPIGSFVTPDTPGYVDCTVSTPTTRPPRRRRCWPRPSAHRAVALAQAAAGALRAPGRRVDRGAAGGRRHHGEDRADRMGAVVVQRLRQQGL